MNRRVVQRAPMRELRAVAEHCPDHPCVLGSDRDACAVITTPSSHGECPTRQRIVLADRPLQNAARSHHEQRAQVGIAATGDTPKALFAAGGVLAWNETEPGGELPTVLELAHVAHTGDDRRGGDRTDSLALQGKLGSSIVASV